MTFDGVDTKVSRPAATPRLSGTLSAPVETGVRSAEQVVTNPLLIPDAPASPPTSFAGDCAKITLG